MSMKIPYNNLNIYRYVPSGNGDCGGPGGNGRGGGGCGGTGGGKGGDN